MISALVPVDEVIVFVVPVLVMPKSVPTFFCAPSSISSSLFLSTADKKPAALCVAVLCECNSGAAPTSDASKVIFPVNSFEFIVVVFGTK